MDVDLDDYSRQSKSFVDFQICRCPRVIHYFFNSDSTMCSVFVSGIYRAFLEGKAHAVKSMVESGVSVNAEDTRYGFTPLHLAVAIKSLELLEYLLSHDDIVVNSNYRHNVSPLHVAAHTGCMKSLGMLIEAGAHVNVRDVKHGDTPLHVSMPWPEATKFLIQKGAHIDAVNCFGETPLNLAAKRCRLETVCMLLYYNADANICDVEGHTPFVSCLRFNDVELERALFEYVLDCNGTDTLAFALIENSPYVGDIIERGADVNYGDGEGVDDKRSAFYLCLYGPVSSQVFKLVWDKISYNEMKNTVDLNYLFPQEEDEELLDEIEEFIQVIIESDNFELAVNSLTANENYCMFIENFAKHKLKLEQLTVFTCRLLQYGYRATSKDVSAVFHGYGFCELLRILLYMDIECVGWSYDDIMPRMMVDLDFKLRENVNIPWVCAERDLLEYFTCPKLIDSLVYHFGEENKRASVPSLIEWSRDAARRYIWNSLGAKSTCQFYTAIDNLKIPSAYKKILTFEEKLYILPSYETDF